MNLNEKKTIEPRTKPRGFNQVPTQTVISVDPGHVSAIAVLTVEPNPGLLFSAEQNFSLKKRLYANHIEMMTRAVESAMPGSVVYIEGQFFKRNPRGLITLVRSSGMWELAATYLGLKSEYVQPSEWQSAELVGRYRRQLKAVSECKVKALYGVTVSDNVADAILQGRFAAIRKCFGGQQHLFKN